MTNKADGTVFEQIYVQMRPSHLNPVDDRDERCRFKNSQEQTGTQSPAMFSNKRLNSKSPLSDDANVLLHIFEKWSALCPS